MEADWVIIDIEELEPKIAPDDMGEVVLPAIPHRPR